jgi:hypothetical protein
VKFAYADPPYIGCAGLYPEKREVDHVALVAKLVEEYPDGWALSCKSGSLRELLPLLGADVRVMPWVKPFAVFKPNVSVAYAWEPVIVQGGRRRTREQATVRDWVSANITLRRGLVGAKPDGFYFWLFAVLNIGPQDAIDDLFPGTGGLDRCLVAYRQQVLLPAPSTVGRSPIGDVSPSPSPRERAP